MIINVVVTEIIAAYILQRIQATSGDAEEIKQSKSEQRNILTFKKTFSGLISYQ